MKKKFFGIVTEIYDDDSYKISYLQESRCNKPQNTLEQWSGVTAYTDWYENEGLAQMAFAMRNDTMKQSA